MAKRTVLFYGESGSFSVGNESTGVGDKSVEISVGIGVLNLNAKFTVDKKKKPKIFEALQALERAMLEEGAEEIEEIIVG